MFSPPYFKIFLIDVNYRVIAGCRRLASATFFTDKKKRRKK